MFYILKKKLYIILYISGSLILSSCAQKPIMNMVTDSKTGLQYGSIVGDNFFTDAALFPNKVIKVTTRNISGDIKYDMKSFVEEIENSFAEKGYEVYNNDGFGIKVDISVRYSGHIQKNMMKEYALLGATVGGISGFRSNATAGTAIGLVAGATLGTIIGSYVTEDTYMMITDFTIGVLNPKKKKKTKTITFSRSKRLQEDDDEDDKKVIKFKNVYKTQIAVFAGGRNVKQDQIVEEVRKRLARIVSDMI